MSQAPQPHPQDIQALVSLFSQGKYAEAATLARALTQRFPHFGFFWKALGAVLMQSGQVEQALEPLQKAAALSPEDAEAQSNWGAALRSAGRAQDAVAAYRRAIALQPGFANAHSNLGNAYRDLERFEEAAASYQRALVLQPNLVDALDQLAYLYCMHRQHDQALALVCRSLQLQETEQARQLFVDCVKYVNVSPDDARLRDWLLRAIHQAWGRPNDLVRAGWDVVRPAAGWKTTAPTLADIQRMDEDALLCTLLRAAQVCHADVERFLTAARQVLLGWACDETADSAQPCTHLEFFAALASQCFINEYIFAVTPGELQRVQALRERSVATLAAGQMLTPLALLALASYAPLDTWASDPAVLDHPWSSAIQTVLTQQLREPALEAQLRGSIASLTAIDNAVSKEVRAQYEESPYPRWVRIPVVTTALSLNQTIALRYPRSPFIPLVNGNAPDILVAGCGTGQHPIGTAMQFADAKVLAVDLSLTSLGYAKRKAVEMGVSSITFAQADILQLGVIPQRFDVIESSGVLHHLADPSLGWDVLLGLLKPGGLMRLGFYSETARRHIVRARQFIAQRGYPATTEGIRECRQDLLSTEATEHWGRVTKSSDFFSTSTCRDLLFHVQEHRTTLTAIAAFLGARGLQFLGFEMEPHVTAAYRHRFPNDPAATNLAQWQEFETDNPDVFFNMYQFWVQKPGLN